MADELSFVEYKLRDWINPEKIIFIKKNKIIVLIFY